LNKKLQPTNLSKQLLKQQAAASASALATGGTKSGSTSPITSSSDASSSTSSMVTLNQPTTTTTTTTSTAPSAPSYLTTLLSNPRSTPQSPLAAQRSVAAAARPGKSQSPPTPSSHSNINNTNQSSSSSISSGSGNVPTTSLWVGNVDSSVTEETLIELFSAYGNLTNVRCLPDKYCAFINYKTKDEAGRAMAALQVRFFLTYFNHSNRFLSRVII
jgi:RNA recognition motif-containing protein